MQEYKIAKAIKKKHRCKEVCKNAEMQKAMQECKGARMQRCKNTERQKAVKECKKAIKKCKNAEMQKPTQKCRDAKNDAKKRARVQKAMQKKIRKGAHEHARVQYRKLQRPSLPPPPLCPVPSLSVAHRGSKSANALRDSGARMSLSRMLTISANLGRRLRSCCQHCIISW